MGVTFGLVFSGCLVVADPCRDGYLNGSESDVDCGGACGVCAVGRRCIDGTDCVTGLCSTAGVCVQPVTGPTCTDGIANGTESDIDCGGSCGKCNDGRACVGNSDCVSGQCGSNNRCVTLTIPNFSGVDLWSIDTGSGVVLQPGTQAGYGITASGGQSYRLVWTGDAGTSSSYHEFYGSVYTKGSFTNVTPGCAGNACPLESGDYVSPAYTISGGQEIDFDTFATTGIDGFDFVSDTEPVYFDLFIDGVHYPNFVYFMSGGVQSAPTSVPFSLQSH